MFAEALAFEDDHKATARILLCPCGHPDFCPLKTLKLEEADVVGQVAKPTKQSISSIAALISIALELASSSMHYPHPANESRSTAEGPHGIFPPISLQHTAESSLLPW